jgi:ribosome-binding factor A
MSPRTRRGGGGGSRNYPRTARLNQLVQEIVAEEIERIEDDRLGLFTVVAVDVEADLRHAVVYYSALDAAPGDTDAGGDGADEAAGDPVVEALAEHRSRLQSAIGSQARMKRTPELTFRPDTVVRQAQRIEEILQNVATEPTADELEARAPEPATPDREA